MSSLPTHLHTYIFRAALTPYTALPFVGAEDAVVVTAAAAARIGKVKR
jgi:hypothetical protein